MLTDNTSFDWGAGRSAVHSVKVTVPRELRSAFFDRLKEYARENQFEIRIHQVKSERDLYFIDLWRRDVAMGGGNVFESDEFLIAVYVDDNNGGTAQAAMALVEGMKAALGEIDGVEFHLEK